MKHTTDLKAGLAQKIQEWADENCEDHIWPEIVVHDEFCEGMADAAFAVFEAMAESQKAAIDYGYLTKPLPPNSIKK